MKIRIAVILFFVFADNGFAQIESQPFRIMFYNVENFFDISDDSLTDDNEFLPGGLMRWNSKRYFKKRNSLYKTIVAAGSWSPPAIIALSEVENRHVLEDVCYRTYLSKFSYDIIHEESPDWRGIDVCLIYRKTDAKLIFYKYLIPKTKQLFSSRSVLYAKFLVGQDTVHIFVNHWPSRRGGVLAGEETRQVIASMVRINVDSLIAVNPESKIIILGDLNCSPDDKIIQAFMKSQDTINSLVNLSDSLNSRGNGTYRFAGSWEMIDQVMVTKTLLNSKSGLYTNRKSLNVFRAEFLLKQDSKYPGLSPFPTYHGYKYVGGFSDHLPVLLDLNVR
jgi:hypothetical protein